MSESVAVQTLNPVINEELSNTEVEENHENIVKVVHPDPAAPPTVAMLMQMYATQERECWLCEGIAKKIAENKEISEDDSWHFTSCVLSWEHLHRQK
ncbi:MAG: hypothetical protein ACQETH_10045 [Candidatus Rifleibacteriota bacterium]